MEHKGKIINALEDLLNLLKKDTISNTVNDDTSKNTTTNDTDNIDYSGYQGPLSKYLSEKEKFKPFLKEKLKKWELDEFDFINALKKSNAIIGGSFALSLLEREIYKSSFTSNDIDIYIPLSNDSGLNGTGKDCEIRKFLDVSGYKITKTNNTYKKKCQYGYCGNNIFNVNEYMDNVKNKIQIITIKNMNEIRNIVHQFDLSCCKIYFDPNDMKLYFDKNHEVDYESIVEDGNYNRRTTINICKTIDVERLVKYFDRKYVIYMNGIDITKIIEAMSIFFRNKTYTIEQQNENKRNLNSLMYVYLCTLNNVDGDKNGFDNEKYVDKIYEENLKYYSKKNNSKNNNSKRNNKGRKSKTKKKW